MTRLKELQAILNKELENTDKKFVVILEGRDTAGKSSTIREVTHYIPNKFYRVIPSFMPSKTAMKNWLSYWKRLFKKCDSKIIFCDRSYYSRAIIQPIMGWCSKRQYLNFMGNVIAWECSQEIVFVKFWLSIGENIQRENLIEREFSPLVYWKLSKNDRKALDHYDAVTIKKAAMFLTDDNWISIDYNNKPAGIINLLEFLTLIIGGIRNENRG